MSAIGLMNERLTIEQPTKTRSTTDGSWTNSWATYRTIWGQKIEETGADKEIGNKIVFETVVNFIVRYDSGLKTTFRLKWKDENYTIVGLREIDRRRYQEIKARRQE